MVKKSLNPQLDELKGVIIPAGRPCLTKFWIVENILAAFCGAIIDRWLDQVLLGYFFPGCQLRVWWLRGDSPDWPVPKCVGEFHRAHHNWTFPAGAILLQCSVHGNQKPCKASFSPRNFLFLEIRCWSWTSMARDTCKGWLVRYEKHKDLLDSLPFIWFWPSWWHLKAFGMPFHVFWIYTKCRSAKFANFCHHVRIPMAPWLPPTPSSPSSSIRSCMMRYLYGCHIYKGAFKGDSNATMVVIIR